MSSEERSSGERASGERASGAHASEKSTQQDIVTHHISDVDTWGGRDRNFFVFACLSLTLGFFGFDHF